MDWQSAVSGFCRCPGHARHTRPNGPKDCRVCVDGAPTIFCFHASCSAAVADANRRLRRELGAAQVLNYHEASGDRLLGRTSPQVLLLHANTLNADLFGCIADSMVRDTPQWLLARWNKHYGVDTARAIAQADGHEPALDLTVKSGAETWAERLRGRVLPTGTVRTLAQGAISLLPGFREGAWWVQDAAAALPARLFGEITGKTILDLCAAPGGKTTFAAALMRNQGRTCGRMAIVESVWDYDFDPETNVIDVYVNYLRKKIDSDREVKLIHTVRGAGYVLKESA